MYEPQGWGRSRLVAFLVVLALHMAVLTGLVTAAKTRLRNLPAAPPIELLILPHKPAPAVPPPVSLPDHRKRNAVATLIPPAESLTVVTPSALPETAAPAIDWAAEAHNAAIRNANGAPPSAGSTGPAPSSNTPFAQAPLHHKGEQIPTADGRWIVYVSDNCYQVSKSITAITNATNTGVGLQTYCTRRSKEARGDLFDQLPAYKKNHPDH